MWIYALFFASKESVNQIEDKAWQARAEAICNETAVARKDLADYRLITDMGPDALSERADIVDKATAMLAEMVSRVAASTPTDANVADGNNNVFDDARRSANGDAIVGKKTSHH